MNTKQATLFLILFGITTMGFAQNNLNSDRPGLSYSASTLPSGSLQYQGGIHLNSARWAYPTLNVFRTDQGLRYGISDKFEVDARVSWERSTFPELNSVYSGLHGVQIMARYQFLNAEQSGIDLSVLASYEGLNDILIDSDIIDIVRIRAAASKTLAEKLLVNVNAGLSYNDNGQPKTGYLYAVNFAYLLGQKTSVFAEVNGETINGNRENFYHGGFTFQPSNKLLFDASAGFKSSSWLGDAGYFSFGATYRII